MTIRLYGIPNCDSVKKARAWMVDHGIAHDFHDYRKQGVDAARLATWCDAVGWERLVNRKGTTFRKLSDGDRAVDDADAAIALMVANPSVIKRPVIEYPGGLLVGYSPQEYAVAFA